MERSLHPINEISTNIQLDGDQRVRLSRRGNGATTTHAEGSHQLEEMVRQALETPLDLPSLAVSVVPGDRIALAVSDGVPRVGEIVCAVMQAFEQAGIDADSISIVAASSTTGRLCRDTIEERGNKLPQFVIHDPDDKDNLCLVGLTKKKHEPLVVNRTIFDADVVLPIGVAGAHTSAYEGLFPTFSSAEARDDYRTPANVSSPEDVAKKVKQTDEAGWMIGVLMMLRVVPGVDETVADVVVGEPQAVARRCSELYRQQWLFHSPGQVSLAIVNISGGVESQNWQNVGRALTLVEPLLDEGGAVAICSNLDEPPGESLSRLMGGDLDKAERKIMHDHADDSISAWHAARALRRGPVYFLSQLDDETVEDLGFAPIGSISELARLAGRHESCVVIDDSQHAIVNLQG